MCGLTGIVAADGRMPDAELLTVMTDSLSHRGPDEQGTLVLHGAALGHRRLTILDPGSGQQPMRSEDQRYTLIYNGEIYNYREINRALEAEGYRFDGHCDTETLLKAWQCWEQGCLERLRGMYAFAVWDAQRDQITLVRDRLGIKPLYYGFTRSGDLVFGSELKALLVHPDIERRLDDRALESYIALGYVPDPMSIFAGIYKLEPGHVLTWRSGQTSPVPEKYWDIDFGTSNVREEEGATRALHERLGDAVRLRMVADVPLGAFLSGGVDSSAIVSLMASTADDRINTCAIGFDQAAFDESSHARRVARHLGTAHTEYRVSGDDFDLIDRLIDVYDEPFADSSALPTFRVCELARRQVKVALSGDGGDENFAGYRRYRLHAAESRARSLLPQALRRPVFGSLGRLYPKLDWAPQALRAKTTFQALAMDTAQAYCHSVSVMPQPLRERLYSKQFKRRLQGYRVDQLFQAHARNAQTEHPLSVAQYLDFKTYLPGDILTKVDRASMAHGLEVRVPLLDHEFVRWSATVVPDLKLRRGEGKYLLKKAFEPYLPHDILYRPKQGFSVPLAAWLRGPLKDLSYRAVTGSALLDTGAFDARGLRDLWNSHQSGRSDHSAALWSLLVLSRFLTRHVLSTSNASAS